MAVPPSGLLPLAAERAVERSARWASDKARFPIQLAATGGAGLRLLASCAPVTPAQPHRCPGRFARHFSSARGFELEVIVEHRPGEGPAGPCRLWPITRQRLLLAASGHALAGSRHPEATAEAGAAEPGGFLWPTRPAAFQPLLGPLPRQRPLRQFRRKRFTGKEAAPACAG